MKEITDFKGAIELNNDLVDMRDAIKDLKPNSEFAKMFKGQILLYINDILDKLHNSKIDLNNEASASKNSECCENLL
ncbi:MAG: hypothetical protein HXS54_01510 [Theionarchaea archaeon]|nr:hypothetical protein [Theionarchaea archaeon]